MWEGGHRVPFFMSWDRFLSSAGANGADIRGTSVDEPVTSLDVLPTILDACGINDPSSNPLLRSSPSDGKSWLPALDGSVSRLHEYLFWFRERAGNRYVGVVRKGPWKLIIDRKNGPGFELFNLKNDVSETNNVAQSYPEIVQELKEEFIKYANEMARRNGEEVPNVRLSRMSSI
jgi:arylsulfatase A-like enzyme